MEMLQQQEWSLRYVLETHVHADHLSRARELVRRTQATLLLPPQRRVRFAFTAVADGQALPLGRATLTAIHTPGHTEESTSYLLDQAAVFTGDTLFTNGVGRPDLHADPEGARTRARALFASLDRLRTLPADVVVLPAHASEPVPFDGRPIAATVGQVTGWLSGWLASEAAFVDRITSRLPPTPPNFVRIVELNERGELPDGASDLEAGANRCAVK
jgi:glyoxylase-like metal-dependent hydrolase (beta-lactamase superfamily II)